MTVLHAFLYCSLFAYSSALLLNPSYAGAEITDSPRNSTAHQAPGAPGLPHHWTSARKVGIGTSYSPESKVWFSLVKGKLSEVYWPTIDTAQLTDMQFLITDGKTFMAEESRDLIQEVKRLDSHSLSYQQINRDPEGRFTLYKTYTTDPKADVLKIAVTFETHIPGVSLYLLVNPAAANTGLYDHAWAQQDALYAFDQSAKPPHFHSEAAQVQAWVSSIGFLDPAAGFVGINDAWQDLQRDFQQDYRFTRATDGNIALSAKMPLPPRVGSHSFTMALGFAKTPKKAKQLALASLQEPFNATLANYQRGWHRYLASLSLPKHLPSPLADLYLRSLMVLKAHEDKTFTGAMIASLSIPWGTSQFDHHSGDDRGVLPGTAADGQHDGPVGYHVVWPRDLYQVATAFIAAGDTASARSALDYLKRVQLTEEDGYWWFCQQPIAKAGAFSQNFWLSGRAHWQGLQLDETALPVILAWRLWQANALDLQEFYSQMIRPAADFIARVGPWTHQERWEEASGVSPSTLASAIAALVTAADMAKAQQDEINAARYLAIADQWADAVKAWTLSTKGPLSDQPYFIRTVGSECGSPWNPNADNLLNIANGGGQYPENRIVDGGFLELVRLGILPIDDKDIEHTLALYDRTLKVETPKGPGFYRYSYDGYGEKVSGDDYDGTGKGRLWPFLTGERGHAALAAQSYLKPSNQKQFNQMTSNPLVSNPSHYLQSLYRFANSGLMLPEQVWDQTNGLYELGEGTGSATPLAWSHAEFIKLAQSINQQRVLDTPKVVHTRYQSCTTVIEFKANLNHKETLYVRGSGPLNWQQGIKARYLGKNLWRVAFKAQTQPFLIKGLVNDERWQQGDDVKIHPCKTHLITPLF